MSRFKRGAAASALLAAFGALALAAPAQAQDYGRLVVFGDSLSDNGNLAALTGGTQPPALFYPSGRFSDGPVFTERLGFDAAGFGATTGSVNYAFGGARTDDAMSPPGMQVQLAAYLGGGGQFGAGDLVSVLGGANNIFDAAEAIALDPTLDPLSYMTAEATGAAADVAGLSAAIAAQGAGTILVTNLPRLSLTPAFSTPPASTIGDIGANTFNAALASGLQSVAAANPGTNIIQVDLFRATDFFAANPGLFGVSNATDPCFDDAALTVCANPEDFFYYDGVHPTSSGHRALAALALDYMYYGDAGAQTTVIGETAYAHRQNAMDAALAGLSGRAGWAPGTRVSATAAYDQSETDARGAAAGADVETAGGRFAFEHGFDDGFRVGLGVGLMDGSIEAGRLNMDVETTSADLWAGWRSASGLFVTGLVGVSSDRFDDIERLTALEPVVHTAKTRSVSTGARLQAGTWFDMGGLALSPRAAVSWISADVDGYAEDGPAAQHAVADRTVEGVSAELALRLEGGGEGFGFYAEGGYRDVLDDRSDAVMVGLNNNTAQQLATAFDNPLSEQMMVNLGVNARLMGRVNLDVGYRGRFAEATDAHMGLVTLSLPF